MSNKIAELMVYAAWSGDPKLAELIAAAMREIETSERPAHAAKMSRIAAGVSAAMVPHLIAARSLTRH